MGCVRPFLMDYVNITTEILLNLGVFLTLLFKFSHRMCSRVSCRDEALPLHACFCFNLIFLIFFFDLIVHLGFQYYLHRFFEKK